MPYLTEKKWSSRPTRLISLLLLAILALSFTPDEYRFLRRVNTQSTIMTTDKFGNVFAVNDKNELVKYDKQGEYKKHFNTNKFGPISFVGANNPLKVLAFYQDYATIIVLDQTMTQTGEMRLYEMGMNQTAAICASLDNNIWIFDEVDYRLKKIDDNLNIILQSEDLSILLNETIRPNFLIEKENFLYVNDPEVGILVFDLFGTYAKTIPIKGLKDFQKFQDKLIYFQGGQLVSYHLKTFEEEVIRTPIAENILNIRLEQERLYILGKKQLDLYTY